LLRAAIIGTGNIGTDLMLKARKSRHVKVTNFIGRRPDSPGITLANSMGIKTSYSGIDELLKIADDIDVVFDATSATDHLLHDRELKTVELLVLNMTPAAVGEFYIPGVTSLRGGGGYQNVNLVTCGGQTSIPLLSVLSREVHPNFPISSTELVSTLASPSAGPATRRNLDEYVENTSNAVRVVTGLENKVILALNPAKPEIVMRSSIYVEFAEDTPDNDLIAAIGNSVEQFVQSYCPGYRISPDVLSIGSQVRKFSLEVESSAEYFPSYAGNLDIINNAAIFAAEEWAISRGDS
jgi:acetaldehyde dehydrogenase